MSVGGRETDNVAPHVVLAVNHVSFVVSDLERSIAWYCGHLGLEVETRQRQDNDYTRKLVGIADAVLDVALLRIPGDRPRRGPILELIEYVTPPGRLVEIATNDVGATHLAFEVSDLLSLYADLDGKAVSFQSPPVAIEAGVNKGGYTCYLTDPDGNRLELHQPPEGRQS